MTNGLCPRRTIYGKDERVEVTLQQACRVVPPRVLLIWLCKNCWFEQTNEVNENVLIAR